MKEFAVSFKEKLMKMDIIVLVSSVAMTALSVLVLWGASNEFGPNRFKVQCIAAVLGILIMIAMASLDYDAIISKFETIFFIISVVLLIIVIVVNLGSNDKSNHNWIEVPGLPFYIQPSEFVKITFIMTFSRHIDRLRSDINNIKNVLKLALHAGIIIGLVMLTKDLGTVLVYMFVVVVMLFSAGLSLWYFAGAAVVMIVAVPLLWGKLEEYQQMRILVGFNPELDPTNYGLQAIRSRSAIIAGGFRGAGLTGGTQFAKVPASHSDFLFCVLAEKLGFFGTFTYLLLMSTLIIRLLVLSRRTRKDYASLICVGVAAVLIAQTLENIGMCLATLPVVGITLPFFSYGGSSLLAMFISMGLIQSICTHNRKYYFEREPSSLSDI